MDASQELRNQEMNGRKRIAMDAIQAVQHKTDVIEEWSSRSRIQGTE